MITPSFNLTATERVLPKLALNFTTAILDPRITFTRSGDTATVTNSNGVIVEANENLPRFDYDPIALTCKGLLIEESRSNLFLYSSAFNEVSWPQTNVTVSSDVIVAPNALLTGSKLILNSGISSGSGFLRQQITKSAVATTYCVSFYAKAGEFNSTRVIVRDSSNGANSLNTYFNLDTGEVAIAATASGTFTNPSANIVAAGNGWYRCILIGTTSTETSVNLRIFAYTNGNTSVTGDGSSGLYIWGAQLEAGDFATSYIPTTAAQVTRTADVATMTGTNFSDWFNASEGAFLFECKAPVTGSSVFIGTVGDGTTTDRIRYMYNTGSMMISVVGGVSQASIDGGTITANVLNKLCAAYKENNYGVSANGNATVANLSGAIPTMNQCVWGSSGTQSFLNGHLSKILYYPQRIIDSEVQAFSKG